MRQQHQVEPEPDPEAAAEAQPKPKLLRGGFRDGSGTSRLDGRAAGGFAFCTVQKLCQDVSG